MTVAIVTKLIKDNYSFGQGFEIEINHIKL